MTKLLAIIFILFFTTSNVKAMEMKDYDIAVLGALNKITGKTSTLEIKIGDTSTFGEINIKVFACQKSSPLDAPESVAFLEITKKETILFKGWMYASSPALSAMEDRVYDIWVTDCLEEEIIEKDVIEEIEIKEEKLIPENLE